MSDVYRLPDFVNGTPFPSRPRSGGFRISVDTPGGEASSPRTQFTRDDFLGALGKIKKQPEKPAKE